MDLLELKKISDGCEIVDNKLVVSSELERTLRFIKENYLFDVLKDIKAVDLKEQGIELIYHLYNTEDEEDLYVSLNVINNNGLKLLTTACTMYAIKQETIVALKLNFITILP